MSLTNYPNGITSFGMPVIGGGGVMTTGNVFFVDSNTGSDAYQGKSPDKPFATLEYAMGKCTADNGDVIFVMPGHTEDSAEADGINIDVEGVSIIGLGIGDDRPTFTLSTATDASIGVNADSVLLANLYFDFTGIDTVSGGLDVDDHDVTIRNCEFLMADTDGQAEVAIACDANSDRLVVDGCRFISPEAGANRAIWLCGAMDDVEIGNCYFSGDFAIGAITTTAAATGLNIHDCKIFNDNAGEPGVDLGATTVASEGMICNCYFAVADTGGLTTPVGSLAAFECYSNYGGGASGKLNPAVWAT